jgi:hypothetical protein
MVACDSSTSVTVTSSSTSCTGHFEASIDGSTVVEGELTMDVEGNGQMKGTLKPTSGADLTVSGQVQGQAISLAISLGSDQYIFGTGALTQPISQCAGVGGGTFAAESISAKTTGGRLPLLASSLQEPHAQIVVENKRVGTWGYAIGG